MQIANNWDCKSYQEFVTYLISIKDEKYRDFNSKICKTKYKMLGIRLPVLRKIIKEIMKTDYLEFLKVIKNNYYEEIMLEGLVIANIKDEKLFFKYFNNYIKKIDDWSICDSVCNSLLILKNDRDKYFTYFKQLVLQDDEFTSRVGLVTILNFYIEEEYLEEIFSILNQIVSDKYYINMAEAWLICELYIKESKRTLEYLKNNKLNTFTHNKAIGKIKDSYRVSKEEKEMLNKLKR